LDAAVDDKRLRFEAQALPHLDAAYNLARWLSRSPADADDIVQDAMIRAYRAFDDVKGGDVKPWLLTIVRNCFLTSAARRTKERKIIPLIDDGHDGDNDTYVDDKPDPEIALMHADEGRKLSRLMAGLPQDFREVVILREMEDLPYRDIAEIIGVPIGTVMSRLARGRAMLKERWSRTVEGGRHVVR
jgi:RNA polymerase sigma-70 factor (ECF subfamily)